VKLVLVAACALVDVDGRVLIAQRPAGKPMAGLWEFPGGKVEAGEVPEQTLIRELAEELGVVVNEACLAPLTFASHSYRDFHLLMPLYVCRRWEGTVTALEGQSMAWVRPNRLRDYPMPPADQPLVSHLMSLSASRCRAEPGANGFCWLSCGAQPESQSTSKVARMRPSGSANRSE
jgi:8-oxo-dGTP diphosphatase